MLPTRGHTLFESPRSGVQECETVIGVYPAASMEEKHCLKSRRHEQAWFGGGQRIPPSLTNALCFEIQGVALVASCPTSGLGISNRGIAEVLDRRGNPPSLCGVRRGAPSSGVLLLYGD